MENDMKPMLLCAALVLSGQALAQDVGALIADTRKQALPVLPKVVGMMQETVKAEGAAGAIPVCKEKAPELLKARADELGWQMGRVSLKARNPERGTPDVWEARQLADFNIRAANGEKPASLEAGEVITRDDGSKVFRYMRAIPVGTVCLACHGDPAQIDAGLKARIAQAYPHDRATGYALGEIRGALTVTRPLP
jgi:mono/diheme cytochrome c family protein